MLKAFKVNDRYGSTFLITGHSYYLATISTCLMALNPSAIEEMIRAFIIS